MTRQFPMIQFGRDIYEANVAAGLLTKVGDNSAVIPLADLPYLQAENKFLIFYREGTGIVSPELLAEGLPSGTRLYRFDGPDKLDPVGYATLHKVDPPPGIAPAVVRAERFRLPPVYFQQSNAPAASMREFFDRMMRWKWRSEPVQLRGWNARRSR
ncbi:hypothetical protein [Chitinophaga barathri]|uniref:Uncharacterized protein n=1 Tax=Chitinophaga barathri TaxID=1647451 RepID=A0A3N4N657_9BACT|nr:hypothetical protein [Chitinophaga barathri]RPD43123.1 hypothetical protein EG028_02175 [Chitinophaga barathri]